jgi:hypothetical protein
MATWSRHWRNPLAMRAGTCALNLRPATSTHFLASELRAVAATWARAACNLASPDTIAPEDWAPRGTRLPQGARRQCPRDSCTCCLKPWLAAWGGNDPKRLAYPCCASASVRRHRRSTVLRDARSGGLRHAAHERHVAGQPNPVVHLDRAVDRGTRRLQDGLLCPGIIIAVQMTYPSSPASG